MSAPRRLHCTSFRVGQTDTTGSLVFSFFFKQKETKEERAHHFGSFQLFCSKRSQTRHQKLPSRRPMNEDVKTELRPSTADRNFFPSSDASTIQIFTRPTSMLSDWLIRPFIHRVALWIPSNELQVPPGGLDDVESRDPTAPTLGDTKPFCCCTTHRLPRRWRNDKRRVTRSPLYLTCPSAQTGRCERKCIRGARHH